MSSSEIQEKTQLEVVKYEHTVVLQIENFSEFINRKEKISLTGSLFDIGDASRLRMNLFIQKDHFIMSLVSCLGLNQRVPDCEFSIINSNGENCNVETKCEAPVFQSNRSGSVKRLLINKQTLVPSSNNQLTMQCKLTSLHTVKISQRHLGYLKSPKKSLVDDLGTLLENGQSADVTLVCKGEKFNAHKLILATRSSVFAAMFNDEMNEKENDCVEIIGLDKDILKEMLKYMYTDKLSNLENETTAGLFAAADMYDLQSLKVECERSLLKQLSIENAADILNLADVHSVHQLKEKTIRFIRFKKMEVIETAKWKELMKERSDLAAEIFEGASEKTA